MPFIYGHLRLTDIVVGSNELVWLICIKPYCDAIGDKVERGTGTERETCEGEMSETHLFVSYRKSECTKEAIFFLG